MQLFTSKYHIFLMLQRFCKTLCLVDKSKAWWAIMILISCPILVYENIITLWFYGNLVQVNYIATTFMHPTGYRRNFNKYSGSIADVQGIPYDFDSLMHYGAYDFAINRNIPVIRPRSSSISLSRIGQRNRLSPYDIMQVNIRYCPGMAATVKFRHRNVM